MSIERPSHKELTRKITCGRTEFKKNGFLPASVIKLAADFQKLGLYTEEEQSDAVEMALEEICPNDYRGARPPELSYEPEIKDCDLFPFSWESPGFAMRMYFKFALKGPVANLTLYVCSLHEDKPKRAS